MNVEQSNARNGRLSTIKSWINDDDEMEKDWAEASDYKLGIRAIVSKRIEKFHSEADKSGGVICHFTGLWEGQRNG